MQHGARPYPGAEVREFRRVQWLTTDGRVFESDETVWATQAAGPA